MTRYQYVRSFTLWRSSHTPSILNDRVRPHRDVRPKGGNDACKQCHRRPSTRGDVVDLAGCASARAATATESQYARGLFSRLPNAIQRRFPMKRIAVLSIIGILGVPIQGQAQSGNAATVDEFERRQ